MEQTDGNVRGIESERREEGNTESTGKQRERGIPSRNDTVRADIYIIPLSGEVHPGSLSDGPLRDGRACCH